MSLFAVEMTRNASVLITNDENEQTDEKEYELIVSYASHAALVVIIVSDNQFNACCEGT